MENNGNILKESSKAIHLVLSSGGVKTFSYIGALQVLKEAGYTVKSVSCCSAGTLIGALFCGGCDLKRLESYVVQNDLRFMRGRPKFYVKWLSWLGYLRYPFATHHPVSLSSFTENILDSDITLKALAIPFATVGIDIGQSNFYIISAKNCPDMSLSEAVRVATTVPFLWSPHNLNGTGRNIVDAAIATKSPSWLPDKLMFLEADSSPIVILKPSEVPNVRFKNGVKSFIESLFHAVATSWDEIQESGNTRLRTVNINCSNFNVHDFGIKPEQKQWLIDEGRSTMRRFISEGNL